MQYSVVEMHHIENHSFNMQKYGWSMYFSTKKKVYACIYTIGGHLRLQWNHEYVNTLGPGQKHSH